MQSGPSASFVKYGAQFRGRTESTTGYARNVPTLFLVSASGSERLNRRCECLSGVREETHDEFEFAVNVQADADGWGRCGRLGAGRRRLHAARAEFRSAAMSWEVT